MILNNSSMFIKMTRIGIFIRNFKVKSQFHLKYYSDFQTRGQQSMKVSPFIKHNRVQVHSASIFNRMIIIFFWSDDSQKKLLIYDMAVPFLMAKCCAFIACHCRYANQQPRQLQRRLSRGCNAFRSDGKKSL